MTPPHVSVVIPTHNRPDLLQQTVESVMAQDYPAFDIHVVQNRTDDVTSSMIAGLAKDSSVPLRYTCNPGEGPAPSRHLGGMAATGDFIAFIDDDCRASEGWLAHGVQAFAPGIGLVQGQTCPDPAQPRHYLEKTVNVPELSVFFETCNIFYRAEAFRQVGGFTGVFAEKFYGEDTDLGWRVKSAGWQVRFAPDALVHHEVFRQPLKNWLLEAWHLRNLPLLVREWPEMRGAMFCRYFLHRQSAGFAIFVLGLLLTGLVGPVALLLALPYIWVRSVERGRYANPVKVVARILLGLPRASVTLVALLVGSFGARSLLL
ncbi:MAG: glycosyltransferase family 2 protein [Roseobacter sp.]